MVDREELARALAAEREAAQNGKHPPHEQGDGLEGWLIDEARKLQHLPTLDLVGITESGAAYVLARNFGDQLRHTEGRGWLAWDGTRWSTQNGEASARQAARIVAAGYLLAAMNAPSTGGARDRAITLARRILSSRGVDGVLKEAASLHPVRCQDASFDPDPWALNTPSGIIDLRTGKVRPHDPSAMLTRITNVPYDPDAKSPRWRRFLHEVFADDKETVLFVLRWLGYCLTGDMREQRYIVAWGEGANGKSTLFNAVRWVMGDYAADINTDALTLRHNAGQANPDIAKLPGVRLAIAPEWDKALRADETLIKQITGGDPISTRFLHRNTFAFSPACKLVIFGNEKPALRGTDEGTWRRPILLPFTQQFTGERADKALPATLRAEATGILADMVRGCVAWQRDGLKVPKALEEAKKKWQDDSDDVRKFIDERCVENEKAFVMMGELYIAFTAWGGKMSQKTFSERVVAIVGEDKRKRTRQGVQVRGLGLRAEGAEGAEGARE